MPLPAGRNSSAALLVDEVFPERPARQSVLSFPHPLRFLFARRPEVMGRVLGIVCRCVIAVGPHQGRKVFTLQTLPGCEEPFEGGAGKVAGFSLHAWGEAWQGRSAHGED